MIDWVTANWLDLQDDRLGHEVSTKMDKTALSIEEVSCNLHRTSTSKVVVNPKHSFVYIHGIPAKSSCEPIFYSNVGT